MTNMWRYTVQRGWEQIGDFLHATAEPEIESENHMCGFGNEPSFTLGSQEGFSVEVYRRLEETGQNIAYLDHKTGKPLDIPKATAATDQFLAKIDIGGSLREVAIPSLPDLLNFLAFVSPICAESRASATAMSLARS